MSAVETLAKFATKDEQGGVMLAQQRGPDSPVGVVIHDDTPSSSQVRAGGAVVVTPAPTGGALSATAVASQTQQRFSAPSQSRASDPSISHSQPQIHMPPDNVHHPGTPMPDTPPGNEVRGDRKSVSVSYSEKKIPRDELPITKKDPLLNRGYRIRLDSGHFSMQGVRNEMEDKTTLLCHPEFNKETNQGDDFPRSFFAVYDGHGGDVSAEYCHQHVHMNLVRDGSYGRDPVAALRNAVLKTDADFCAACRRIHLVTSSGTTAIAAYVEDDLLVVANVGDSRGVLSRSGKAVAVSVDHKPGRPDERERIESHGGKVGTTEEEAFKQKKQGACSCLKKCFQPKRPLRVFPGGLSVSRTIGDISLKAGKLIVADPEMFKCQLTAEDQFLALACDGVWDVMSNQQAVDTIKKHMGDPETASRALAKEAYRRGSTDNISVIVVFFTREPIGGQQQQGGQQNGTAGGAGSGAGAGAGGRQPMQVQAGGGGGGARPGAYQAGSGGTGSSAESPGTSPAQGTRKA